MAPTVLVPACLPLAAATPTVSVTDLVDAGRLPPPEAFEEFEAHALAMIEEFEWIERYQAEIDMCITRIFPAYEVKE